MDYRCLFTIVLAASGAMFNCVSQPDPPDSSADLSGLGARYDHLTAIVSQDRIAELFSQSSELIEVLQSLNGLHFIRTIVSDTSSGLSANTISDDLELQGVVRATIPCSGDGPVPTSDGATNGTISATFGLEHSRLKRNFNGRVDGCRFAVKLALGDLQHVVVTATLDADMNADLGFNSEFVSPILVRLTSVTGTSTGPLGTVDLATDVFDFRMKPDNSLEKLFDLATLGLGDLGTVIFVLRPDGTIALRDSVGEWSCSSGTSLCVLVP